MTTPTRPTHLGLDLVCLSHLRWKFVFQRPQHLLTRFARSGRVFYVEEPMLDDTGSEPALEVAWHDGVAVVTPHLSARETDANSVMRRLLDDLLCREGLDQYVLWFYTPMAVPFTRHLTPRVVVFDCMDELSAFAQAPAELRGLEAELLQRADVVFTGGQSLYEAKQHAHPNVHAFPSSVDVEHFAKARRVKRDPTDQATIPRPRLGYFGVIDERMDLELLAAVADLRPDWHFVMVGPVIKIDEASLPRRSNVHYLGAKTYEELPQYVGRWDVALMPFARNEATRFISPTKTPEYLAAGRPVVSTAIRDVVRPYGQQGLVRIANEPFAFVAACVAAMAEDAAARVRQADAFLENTSWDDTWRDMRALLDDVLSSEDAVVGTADARGNVANRETQSSARSVAVVSMTAHTR